MSIFILTAILAVATVNALPQAGYPYSSQRIQQSQGYEVSNFGSSYQPTASGGYQYPTYGPTQETIVQKHIYVHVAPSGFEDKQEIKIAPKRKNVKIIFIKAPSIADNSNQHLLQQKAEEKTLVYVLVKKPEEPLPSDGSELNVPSKPEVYFIKYKTQSEQPGYPAGPTGTSDTYGPPIPAPPTSYGPPGK